MIIDKITDMLKLLVVSCACSHKNKFQFTIHIDNFYEPLVKKCFFPLAFDFHLG